MPDSERADHLIHVALTLILLGRRSLGGGDEGGRDNVLSTFLIQYRQPSVKLEQKISLRWEGGQNSDGDERLRRGGTSGGTSRRDGLMLRRGGGNGKSIAPGERLTDNPGGDKHQGRASSEVKSLVKSLLLATC
jgi:hypothetical protein